MHTKNIIALFVLVAVALGLRFSGLTSDSLWLDEGYQSMVGAYGNPMPDLTRVADKPFRFEFGQPAPVDHVLKNFRQVDPLCPPLYAVLLNRWMTAFGTDDFAVRSMSVMFSIASLGVVFCLTRSFFGFNAAVLAGLIQAVSPWDIHYAQEARMYSLNAFASVLSCSCLLWLMLRQMRTSTRALLAAAYGIATWALINSHYTGLFVVAFQVVFAVLVVSLKRNWGAFLSVTAGWVIALLLWLPWLSMFLQSAKIRTAAFYVIREPSFWWPFYAALIRIPSTWMIFLSGNKVVAYAVPSYLTSFTMLSLALVALIPVQLRRNLLDRWSNKFSASFRAFLPKLNEALRRVTRDRAALIGIFPWALLPASGLWLIDVLEDHKVIEVPRYLMGTEPALYIIAGIGLSLLVRMPRILVPLLTVHIALVLVTNIYVHQVPQREPWKRMAEAIERKVPVNQPIVVSQYYDIICLDRYLRTPYRKFGVSSAMSAEQLQNMLANEDRYALLTAQEGESITAALPTDFELRDRIDLHHGLHLRLYERRPQLGTNSISK